MEELSPTGRVILGMLGFGPKSGYEVKQIVDHSTRFFWAASYGQIYPELRRLAEAGLIEATGEPEGGRRRAIYDLTDAGREALREWLNAPAEIQELRDESMLKLFFSGVGGKRTTVAALEAKRDHHREIAERLREVEELKTDRSGGTYTTLRLGVAFNDFIAEWCDREAKEQR
jgi:PadR family transcriptional regulator, regulatory protein AphA